MYMRAMCIDFACYNDFLFRSLNFSDGVFLALHFIDIDLYLICQYDSGSSSSSTNKPDRHDINEIL